MLGLCPKIATKCLVSFLFSALGRGCKKTQIGKQFWLGAFSRHAINTNRQKQFNSWTHNFLHSIRRLETEVTFEAAVWLLPKQPGYRTLSHHFNKNVSQKYISYILLELTKMDQPLFFAPIIFVLKKLRYVNIQKTWLSLCAQHRYAFGKMFL